MTVVYKVATQSLSINPDGSIPEETSEGIRQLFLRIANQILRGEAKIPLTIQLRTEINFYNWCIVATVTESLEAR